MRLYAALFTRLENAEILKYPDIGAGAYMRDYRVANYKLIKLVKKVLNYF